MPITILRDEKKETVLGLHEVLSLLELPTGWVQQQTDDPPNRMVLVTLLETSIIMVTIDNSFDVALKCDGHVVNLEDFPQILRRVNNMRELHSVLTTIAKYKVSRGNLIEEFKNVLDDETLTSVRMGAFGIINVCTFINNIIIGKEIIHQQHYHFMWPIFMLFLSPNEKKVDSVQVTSSSTESFKYRSFITCSIFQSI